MEIKELQKLSENIVDKIDNKLEIKHNPTLIARHLIEEFGELIRQLNNLDLRKKDIDLENIKEEIADIIILINKLGCCFNIDIEQCVLNKIENLKKRHDLK